MNKLSVKDNSVYIGQTITSHKVFSNIDQLVMSNSIDEQIENEQIHKESIPIVLTEENEEFFNFFYPVRYINSTVYHLANKPIFFHIKKNNIDIVLSKEIQAELIYGSVVENCLPIDITMRVIENMIRMYRVEITRLRRKFDEYEAELHQNKNNEILITLNDFEQTLFYYIDGLKSNLAVLRLASNLQDTQKIETTIIHLIQMAETSVSIITSTRETFSNVIGNDLNIVMKLLTIITVCLAVPNLFFSFYGMNINLPLQEFRFAYIILTILAASISIWIYRKINK